MSTGTRTIRILLADDSDDFRALLRILLDRQPGFEVVAEAADGLTAVELTKKHQPDICLLDAAMPKMDGLQALPAIREANPETKVVMLSAFSAEEMGERATRYGAHAYLEKGELLENLMDTIVRLCASDISPD